MEQIVGITVISIIVLGQIAASILVVMAFSQIGFGLIGRTFSFSFILTGISWLALLILSIPWHTLGVDTLADFLAPIRISGIEISLIIKAAATMGMVHSTWLLLQAFRRTVSGR